MNKLNQRELLRLAYDETNKCSLLNYDCAVLCKGICCKSNAVCSDTEGGMSLFPNERDMCVFDGAKVKSCDDGEVLICSGTCNRDVRPFMCRIFPYYAKISYDKVTNRKRISLIKDPRAFGICPVAQKKNNIRTSVYFKRHTRRAVRILISDKQFENEFMKHSEFAENLYQLYQKML